MAVGRVWGVVMLFCWMNMFFMKTPSKFQLGLKFDRVFPGLLSLQDVGVDLCLVVFT